MKDLKSQKGSEESAVVDHKCVPDGQSAERPVRLTHTCCSLSTCRRGAPKTKRATA